MTKKDCMSLVVFSLNVAVEELVSAISTAIRKDTAVFCLSPHLLFDPEKAKIRNLIGRDVSFFSFYEFISQEEMEYCDLESDKIILQKYGTREGRLGEYFNKIKQMKNEIILKNISLKYEFEDKLVLADDLGIDEDVWSKNGFKRIDSTPKQERAQKTSFAARVYGILKKLKKIKPIILLRTDTKKYYFIGKIDRVLQYLDASKCELIMLPFWEMSYLYILGKCAGWSRKLSGPCGGDSIFGIILFLFRWIKGKDIPDIISSMHEYRDDYGYLASRLNVQMICLQDGFLPGYYPSAYLKYRVWVNKHYIWDRLSKTIFERHALSYEIWECFKKMKLPLIGEAPCSIRKIVFLSSGAGDWTALKNRSDEDLSFLAVVDAAKDNPGIEFVYRPHPLWMHPEHQGVYSIQRLFDYASEIKVPNFFVSAGALKEGDNFNKSKQVSFVSTTINEDINSSDIVLGDHSQALITAAQRGKIISSVSLAQRTEFFSDYTQLGFPILRSAKDITGFIGRVEGAPDFIGDYNRSVELYNEKFS